MKHWWKDTAGKKEVLWDIPLPWQGWWLPTWPMAWSPYLHVQFIPLQFSNFILCFKIPRADSSTSGSKAVWDLGSCMGLNTPEAAKISELKWRQQPPFAVYHWNSTWQISPLAHIHTCGIYNYIQFIHNEWHGQRNFYSRTQFTQLPFKTALYFMYIHYGSTGGIA